MTKEDIINFALEAGFHAAGVTSATAEEWSAVDGQCSMPDSAPGSIISVALSYLTDEEQTDSDLRGSVARFARGLDYHRQVQERLALLADRIRSAVGGHVEIRSFCDTGPLADRDVAVRAGVGSIGKNTCLYAGEYGSWVVLGELVTNLGEMVDGQWSTEARDICGSCDLCMEACPTGAICAPYKVDSRRCLSQLTQMKGYIPRDLREKMGTRIYGCDTCQNVCPLNKGARPGNVDAFRGNGLGASPELLPLLNMSASEFKEKVELTTAGWVRRTRFRRNVAVALGNIGDPSAVPGLIDALADPEPLIRGHAAWSLGKIGTPQARLAFEKALVIEADETVRAEIVSALNS